MKALLERLHIWHQDCILWSSIDIGHDCPCS
jgi:hypothetical protein